MSIVPRLVDVSHTVEHGIDLAELPLTSLANLDTVVVRAVGRRDREITRVDANQASLRGMGTFPVRAFALG